MTILKRGRFAVVDRNGVIQNVFTAESFPAARKLAENRHWLEGMRFIVVRLTEKMAVSHAYKDYQIKLISGKFEEDW